jgi:hypothetical protein
VIVAAKEGAMSHLRLVLCRVENDQPDKMTELAAVDLPETRLDDFSKENCLDLLEERTQRAGQALMKPLFAAQWNEVDTLLTQQTRQAFSPSVPDQGRACPLEGGKSMGQPGPAPPVLRGRGRRPPGSC